MKKLRPTREWILICFMTIVSGRTEHAPAQHNTTQHGDSTAQKRAQNTIIPFGIQIPEHVLSTQDVTCISADENIFHIMDEALKTCNGTDMRCTFYHFVNHGYENIGTLNVNKELFDDLLMKFDNWLLTAENIDKGDGHGKIKEGGSADNIHVNDKYKYEGKDAYSSNTSAMNGVDINEGKVDHIISELVDDRIHSHHVKNQDETHHKNHHHKLKNGNHIKLNTEYNNEHKYFEVFLPKDKETGKPRTIYVEIDRDKNEFVLLDEDIDKKLNGTEPIKIELDELSEIADSAFTNLVKSSKRKDHVHNNLVEEDRVMTGDVNTNPGVNYHEVHLGTDADELTQYILNPSICNPNICNINTNQQLIHDKTTDNVKKVINVSKSLVLPNKYINQAQFHVESHIDNTANLMPNNNFEIIQNTNELDTHDADNYEQGPFYTIEFDHNNITELDINSDDNSSLEFIEIPQETESNNCTENQEYSIEHENIAYDDNDLIQLVDNNDANDDINVDDTHDFGSSNTVHLNDLILQDEENNQKSTPDIYVKPKSFATGIPDNRQGYKDLENHLIIPSKPISQYATDPKLGLELAKAIKTDSNLQSSFPVYATTSDCKNSSVHPTVTSHNSPFDSDLGQQSIAFQTPQYTSPKFPSLPVVCAEGPNRDSKYPILHSLIPPNFGVNWSPSNSPIEEILTPCASKSLSLGSISSPKDYILPTSDVQKPCSTASPFNLGTNTQTPPKHATNIDFPSTPPSLPFAFPLSGMPYSPIEAANTPCSFQTIPSYLQPNKNNLVFGNNPFDNNYKEKSTPCSANRNSYPCNTIPYLSNPYLKPSQFIQPSYDQQLPETLLLPTSKVTFDSPPVSLDQTNPCLNADYPRETKPMPLLPFVSHTPFLPLNPLCIGSGFPNTCQPSIWNNIPYQNIPYLPYSALPAQTMLNYSPSPYNYLAPTMELQQNQILNPLPTNTPKSILEESSPSKNIVQMTPSTYAPSSQVFTRPVPMNLNPSFSLERDLQILSRKYSIPLSKILESLEAEMFDSSNTSSSNLELPNSILEHDSSSKGKSICSATNAAVNDDNRIGKEEIPFKSDVTTLTHLESSLIGPHLDIENAPFLASNDNHAITVASENSEPLKTHLSLKNQPKQIFQNSSLIGPHLSTLSTNHLQFSDEDQIGNVGLHLDSDSSSLIPLDSTVIRPHLEIHPSLVLDPNISQESIVTSLAEIPGSSSSQVITKLNIQNQPTQFSLDSSLTGPHLGTLANTNLLFSNEIQNINDMISLESELNAFTPLDSAQLDPGNEQSVILQHENTAETLSAATDRSKLTKSIETNPKLIEDEFLLDSSLIGPHLHTEISSDQSGSVEMKHVSEISQDGLQKANELETIILPLSMLQTLLKKAVTPDLTLSTHVQDAQLNAEHNKLLLGTTINLPVADPSLIAPALIETEIKTSEPILIQQAVDSDMQLDRSFIKDPIPLHNIETKEKFSSLDSSIQLDNSLIGPSILHELDFEEMPATSDSMNYLESSVEAKFSKTKPSKDATVIGSEMEYDRSLTSPSLYKEIKSPGPSITTNFVAQLDNSLIGPSLDEALGTSILSSVSEPKSYLFNSVEDQDFIPEVETLEESSDSDLENVLDTSLIGPHLSTASFSTDEIKMINRELQLESDIVHQNPLDSSLIGSHLDFESQLDDSQISRYQSPELSHLIEELNSETSIYPSELQELLSKFSNAITKSHLSPTEIKPCDKLLSSISKILSDSKHISSEELQTYTPILSRDELASNFSPRPQTVPFAENYSPIEYVEKGQPCINSNYFTSPVTFPQYNFAKEVPQITIKPYSPFFQPKPLIQHNWQRLPLNIQNLLPSIRPFAENAPVPFISNALESLSPEEERLLLDLATQSNIYPKISNPKIFTPGTAISPSSERNIPSPIAAFLPKKSLTILPSTLESKICDTEYNPVLVDDIMSLINENSNQIHKDMPFSKSFVPPDISEFEEGDIISPALFDYFKSRPVLNNLLKNTMIPSSFYNPQFSMNNPENTQTLKYIPQYNLQPYPYVPEEALFSEMIETAPKSLTSQSPNLFLGSQLRDITNTPQFIESIANPIEKAYLQQLMSKPCLDSPIVIPTSALEELLQLSTASNVNAPCKSPPVNVPPIYSFYSTPTSNAFASPFLPCYASPLSAPSAKSISPPRLDLPFTASPITSPKLSVNPYINSPCLPQFPNPLTHVKAESSGYTYLPTEAQNRPILSAGHFKPCQAYSSPYLPVQPQPIQSDTSPYSPLINKLTAEISSPYSPVCSQPISAPNFRPASKSFTNLGSPVYFEPMIPVSAMPMSPKQTDTISPSYFSSDSSFIYASLPDTNKQKPSSSALSSAYLTPIPQENQKKSMDFKFLPSNSMSYPISLTNYPELQSLRPTSTLPGAYGNNPLSNMNKILPKSPNIPMPISSVDLPKLSPFSNSQLKQNEDIIQSNLQTSPLVQEIPFYNVREENIYTHGNDNEKYNQEPTFNYPLESMSLTLASEEITETLHDEGLTDTENITSAPITNPISYPPLQEKLYQKPCVTPYTSPYGKPCPMQKLPQLPLTAHNQQNMFDNISLMPLSNPLKHSALQPITILSNSLLKQRIPVTPAPNLSILPSSCLDTSLNPYNMLPLKKDPLLYSPYYSTISRNVATSPIDPIVLKDISSPALFQARTNTPFTSISSPKSQTSSPVIPNNLVLSSPFNDPIPFAKSSSMPNINQYAAPILSYSSNIEETITPQYCTPLLPAENFKKFKPLSTAQYKSSISPAPTIYHDSIPLYETPIHYQEYKIPPSGLPSSAMNIFSSTAPTLPCTVLPPFNNVAEPLSMELYKPKWPSFTPQYSLPASSSLSAPVSSPTVTISSILPLPTPKAAKQALTNNIIPSSLYTIPDINLITTYSPKTLSPTQNIPRFTLPSPTVVEPLQTIPYETLSSSLENSFLPKNILKPNRQSSSSQSNVPLSSSPYVTQLLQPIDFYPGQPTTEQYISKPHPLLSSSSTPHGTPSLTPSFIPLPLKSVSNQRISEPQYSLPNVPIFDTPIQTSSSRNPFLNLKIKPVSELPLYSVPNNLISSPKVTPFDSMLLSNLRPPAIYQEYHEPYSKISPSPSLFSSPVLEPSTKHLKSQLYQPEINPVNSQYVSPIESNSQVLPATTPILKSPLIRPLTNSKNKAPIFPTNLPYLKTASSESTPTKISSVTSGYQYPCQSTTLLSEIPQTSELINRLPVQSNNLSKSRFKKLHKIPGTITNTPLYTNSGIVEPSPELTMKANIVSIAKPTEVSAFDSSLLSLEPLNPEIVEEIKPVADSKYRLSPLPMKFSQQREIYPAYTSKYLSPKSPSKYITSKLRPSLVPKDVEFIDTTDFMPLSQIKSEPLISEYSPTDKLASILQNPPTSTPDVSQFSPYSTLSNAESTSPTHKKLPPKSSNQSPRPLPLFLSPQEYKELIQGPSISVGSPSSSSSSNILTSNYEPQLVSSPSAGKPRPVSIESGSWLQSPLTLVKYLPPNEIPVEVPPETQSKESLLNNYRLFNKMTPLEASKYPKELISSIYEVPLEHNILKPSVLTKSGPNTEYGDKYLSDFNEFDSEIMPLECEIENNAENENRVGSIDGLPDIIKDLNIPIYNEKSQMPQRLSKSDHFYTNNHIGQRPQVYMVPSYKMLPIDVRSPFTTVSQMRAFNKDASKNLGSIPKLDTTSQMRPNEYPEYENSLKDVPITNLDPQTYINPYSEAQREFSPNQIKIDDISKTSYQPLSYDPHNNINNIKYSGYKTYQLPSLKKSTQNLGAPAQINNNVYKPSEFQSNPGNFHFYNPTVTDKLRDTHSRRLADMTELVQTKLGLETLQKSPELNDYKPSISQDEALENETTPLQSKLELNTVYESPEYDEYNPIEDETVSVDNILVNEDNELKSSLINYINNRSETKSNLDNNDGEITIPIGNIALIKKEPNNADTIETNNPSIGLKVWKTKVKIAQAELKLTLKDVSVNNFMPVVNNIEKYDMEEIRKIVKNYIDEKYGAHIEANEPYTIDNKYSVIKNFDRNAVENKYNILWPTQYV